MMAERLRRPSGQWEANGKIDLESDKSAVRLAPLA